MCCKTSSPYATCQEDMSKDSAAQQAASLQFGLRSLTLNPLATTYISELLALLVAGLKRCTSWKRLPSKYRAHTEVCSKMVKVLTTRLPPGAKTPKAVTISKKRRGAVVCSCIEKSRMRFRSNAKSARMLCMFCKPAATLLKLQNSLGTRQRCCA